MYKKIAASLLIGFVLFTSCCSGISKNNKDTEVTGEYTVISPAEYNLKNIPDEMTFEQDVVTDAQVAEAIGDIIIRSFTSEEYSKEITKTYSML